MRVHPRWLDRALLPLLLTIACAAVYVPAVDHAYVSFSEGPAPLDDPSLHEPFDAEWLVGALLHPHHGTWAPLPRILQRLEANVTGFGNATTVVLPGAALLAIAAMLFASVLRAVDAGRATSALAAGILVLHPLMADVVCRADTRGDLIALVLVLLAVRVHVADSLSGTTREALVFVCAMLAVLSSPLGIFVPFALCWSEATAPEEVDTQRHRWYARIGSKVPLFALALLGLSLASLATRRGAAALFEGALDPPALVAARTHAWATALLDVAWPFGLTTLRSHAVSAPGWDTPVLVLAVAGAVLLLARRLRAMRPSRALSIALVTSLPMLFVPGPWAPAARWSLLPLLATAWLIAHAITAIRPRLLTVPIALLLSTMLGTRAVEQVRTWRDPDTALAHAIEVDPASWLAHDRLAQRARAFGDLDTALAHGLTTLQIAPAYGAAAIEVAAVMAELDRPWTAEWLARHAVRTDWPHRDASLRLGLTLVRVGLDEPGQQLLHDVVRDDPRSSDARAGLALALARAGDTTAAKLHLSEIEEDALLTEEARMVLVWLLATAPEPELGDPARALAIAETALRAHDDPDFEWIEAKAIAQSRLGRWTEAFTDTKRAAALAAARGWTDREATIRARLLALLRHEAWTEPRERGARADQR